ncbi:MAG: radical SAM protein [Candidatus Kuenenia sp.]|nr:radical SAM protein [Candidatus Kuenenia hertensis]
MRLGISERLIKKYYRKNVPVMVHWEVTYGCNLSCIHCYTRNEIANGLSLPQLEKIALQMKEAGTLYIVITGGEPFYRSDILEIIRMMRKNFFVIILSNATFIDSYHAKKLKELNVWRIEVTLFSMDEGIHDSITGVKGSHKRTMIGVNILKEEGINVTLKMPLLKQNDSEYSAIVKFAEDSKFGFIASPMIIPRLDGSKDTYQYSVDENQINNSRSQWLPQMKEYIASSHGMSLVKNEKFSCYAGNIFCSITADGFLKPCPVIPIKLGSLLEFDFKELWEKKPNLMLQKMRKASFSDFNECVTCECSSWCTPCFGINALDNGDPFSPSDTHCEMKKEMAKSSKVNCQK